MTLTCKVKVALPFSATVRYGNEAYSRSLSPGNSVKAKVFQMLTCSSIVIQYTPTCNSVFNWMAICYLC